MASGTKTPRHTKTKTARNYRPPESESPMRPEVGTQAQFKKKLPPQKCRYDSSLSCSLRPGIDHLGNRFGGAVTFSGQSQFPLGGSIQLSFHGNVSGASLSGTTDMTSRGLFGTVTNSGPLSLAKQ